MNRQDWHKWRKEGIGSSDAAIIMKKFPFGRTPYQLYCEKISPHVCSSTENRAMSHGNTYEDKALDWFERRMDCVLSRQDKVEHKELNWMRATIDGRDIFGISVEVKCPYNLNNHNIVKKTGKIPDIYYPQCQHQIKVLESKGTYFESYNWTSEDDSVIIEVRRDDAYIEELVEEETKFMECIKNKRPPPLTQFDFLPMEDNTDWLVKSRQWKKANLLLKRVEKKEKTLRENLLSICHERDAMGNGVKVFKSECDGAIDYKLALEDYIHSIKSLHPKLVLPTLDLDLYRKNSFTKWNFRPIQEEGL